MGFVNERDHDKTEERVPMRFKVLILGRVVGECITESVLGKFLELILRSQSVETHTGDGNRLDIF